MKSSINLIICDDEQSNNGFPLYILAKDMNGSHHFCSKESTLAYLAKSKDVDKILHVAEYDTHVGKVNYSALPTKETAKTKEAESFFEHLNLTTVKKTITALEAPVTLAANEIFIPINKLDSSIRHLFHG